MFTADQVIWYNDKVDDSIYMDDGIRPKIYKEDYQKPLEVVTEEIEVPMPCIVGEPDKGPIVITKDWYVKHKKKQMAHYASNRKDAQIKVMQMLAEKDRLRYELGQLDPSKKKDSKMIVALNVRIKDIEADIESLEYLYDFKMDKLDLGSRLGQFVHKLKKIAKTVKKKIVNFFYDHEETIMGLLCIFVPAIIKGLSLKLVKAFA